MLLVGGRVREIEAVDQLIAGGEEEAALVRGVCLDDLDIRHEEGVVLAWLC